MKKCNKVRARHKAKARKPKSGVPGGGGSLAPKAPRRTSPTTAVWANTSLRTSARPTALPTILARGKGSQGLAVALNRYAVDDRFSLAMLLAPFMIIALSLSLERSLSRFMVHVPPVVVGQSQPVKAVPGSAGYEQVASLDPRRASLAPPVQPLPRLSTLIEVPAPPLPRLSTLIEVSAPPLPRLSTLIEVPAPPLPRLSTLIEVPAPPLPRLSTLIEVPAPPLPRLSTLIEVPAPPLPRLSTLIEVPAPPLPRLSTLMMKPDLPICAAKPGLLSSRKAQLATAPPPRDPAQFGLAVSAAAMRQLDSLVIYNARYQRINYPMGDVAPMFGVCTDVVVRAYRDVGVDLQALIHETRSGRGDRHIDHRRVGVVRAFLAKYGETLPISDMAEDYQPGDIVTYYRPQNRTSNSHIAIVTDKLAPSGRLMIVHNRGWGPQLEDALFVDKITGHYRFTGMKTKEAATPSRKAEGKGLVRARLARQ